MKFNTTVVFAVAEDKTRDAKILINFGMVKLPYVYGNVTSFFLTRFNLKFLMKKI